VLLRLLEKIEQKKPEITSEIAMGALKLLPPEVEQL
jgi:hypothetical protein